MSEKELDSSVNKYEEKYKSSNYVKQLQWDMAIGLQEVDNLKPSKYLEKLLGKEVEGSLTIEEVEKELKEYLRGKKDFSLELIELIALNLKTTPEDLMLSKNNKLLFRGYLESQARRRKLHKIGDIAGIIGAIIICICLCIMDVTLIINEINSTSGLVISSAIIIMFLVIDIVNKVQSKF